MLVAIGLISYPLYLWHWPLLSFIRIVNGTAPSAAAAALAILLSFALAWLTYFLVEKPLRFGKSAPVKAAALLVVMAAIGSAGYFTYAKGGFAFRNPGAEDLVAAAQDFEHAEADEWPSATRTPNKPSWSATARWSNTFPGFASLLSKARSTSIVTE